MKNKRLLIVQYAGDYRKTFKQIQENGIETYHAQKYVINSISHISQEIEDMITNIFININIFNNSKIHQI
jgi:hypothetical protein